MYNTIIRIYKEYVDVAVLSSLSVIRIMLLILSPRFIIISYILLLLVSVMIKLQSTVPKFSYSGLYSILKGLPTLHVTSSCDK